MNIVGLTPLKSGLTMKALPTQLNAFTKSGLGSERLQPLHERFVLRGEVLQDTVHWRRIGDRVRGVDDGLAGEIGDAGRLQRGFGRCPFGRQHDDLAELRRVLERADLRFPVRLGLQLLALAGRVGADRDVVAVLDETVGERLPDDA